jgi:ABC-type Na+ efflux pump permease subunit
MAGAIGGAIFCIAQVLMFQFFGPAMFDEMRTEMAGQNMPPEAQAMMEKLFTGQGLTLLLVAFFLPVFALFGTLGSLLGLVFFRKKTPPQAPIQQQPPQFG